METKKRREWIRGARAGKGSFGTVSLAVDKATGELFAVKSVSLSSSPPASVAALQNEIEILRSLSSPYIVSYLGEDITEESSAGKTLNLHMEYIAGGTLSDVGKMDERDVRGYTRCLARALLYLHNFAGVVHGDIKGRNVLVVPGGGAKLADFGSASRVSEKRFSAPQGTPLYMAPEVLRGETQSAKSDVWSLGCTVIEIATGKRPWERYNENVDAVNLLLCIGYGDELPEFPSGFSEMGLDFLDKCLSRDPSKRWSCEQLLQHPFLADDGMFDDAARPSPRSVFDWACLDFQEDDEDYQERSDPEDPSVSASERIMQLASPSSPELFSSWNSDGGWITVREAENSSSAAGDDEIGICWEYLDSSRAESEECANMGGDEVAADGTRCCNDNKNYSELLLLKNCVNKTLFSLLFRGYLQVIIFAQLAFCCKFLLFSFRKYARLIKNPPIPAATFNSNYYIFSLNF